MRPDSQAASAAMRMETPGVIGNNDAVSKLHRHSLCGTKRLSACPKPLERMATLKSFLAC